MEYLNKPVIWKKSPLDKIEDAVLGLTNGLIIVRNGQRGIMLVGDINGKKGKLYFVPLNLIVSSWTADSRNVGIESNELALVDSWN
ncbi:hypothetical protein UFOVP244_138 [uncultured Caudovirales phage]|uniref:Uncharacterized protein n=1 Tax=uncultured Caudovirales phage TaxID=2100421 RepID=A0A6J7X220_9CAUD|nr:hypothetical protein UFOVP244_138 [uncultured Caudovirales phage]